MLLYCALNSLKKINCGEIIKDIAIKSNGSGGGSSTYAGGGTLLIVSTNIDSVKDIVKILINDKMYLYL